MVRDEQAPVAAPPAAGLSAAEAAARLERYGPNIVSTARPTPLWHRIGTQLRDPLILVLLVAIALTIATGDYLDTSIISFVVVVNTAVGVTQEVRAERAVMALRELSAPGARVVRDGEERHVPSSEVVPGDLVLLGEGDIVPADGELLEEAALLVDESSLTGEAEPVGKPLPADGEQRPVVSAGTVVVRGRARFVVTATGADSATGRIAALMTTKPAATPLQRRLAAFGRVLAAVAVVLCLVVLVIGLLRGQDPELMAVTAISLVVAAVPESLPAVVTLGLALGARRMAERNAIVRRLPAVETLGSVTVIATDKTGTLTEGRMSAQRLWTRHGTAAVSGTGYAPEGRVEREDTELRPDTAPDVTELLTAAVLCNDAALQAPDATDGEDGRSGEARSSAQGDEADWHALGDPTEAALLTAGARLGLDREALAREWPRTEEIPFTSDRARMTTVHRRPGGGLRVVCKGAPEVVLVPEVLADGAGTLAEAAEAAGRLAGEGYRVLAVAVADRAEPPEGGGDWESGLNLLGLIGILDPPREAAAETVAACRRAGIIPVLITGDHPLTAGVVARRLGVVEAADQAEEAEEVTTGDRIRDGSAGDLTRPRVFARTSPEQKLDIVQAWRGAGHVVAMTGDGVNDGPALHRADIGVAMGRRGTEVARQAADLVLADDDLGTVVAAVEEGRRVYANVRRFLLYGLAGGAAEILVMLFGPFLGMPLPLLPAQILWINLLTHGLPGVALGAEPVAPDTMRQPPRPPEESVLGAGLWPRILAMGLVIAGASLGVGIWAHETGRPWQTMVFLVLGATQLGVGLASRARPGTFTNPFLLVGIAAALALQIAGVYLPPLQKLLGTEALSAGDLLIGCALSAVGYAAMRLQVRLSARAGRSAGAEAPEEPEATGDPGAPGVPEDRERAAGG
ncbi:cation-transporting P-type ATPase [Streptomyces xinghaiensis]|uniref:cation-translocating P-type ATPase n=1 Tax=Streptomyces xinghaiensis TaxID=1038928 RepID=UPI002E14F133|nr:cation-transporting P-type ATPase [Streptomyces xinghaiensis]